MGEQVAQAASRLVPLLVVLLAVFGVLIVAALVLRARVRAESWARQKERSRWQPQVGEPCMILGRAFKIASLETMADGAQLLSLQAEQAAGRLLVPAEGESILYFPGTLVIEGLAEFPRQIAREGEIFQINAAVVELAPGHRLAGYECGGKLLLVEERNGKFAVWRGKTIPREGFGPLEK